MIKKCEHCPTEFEAKRQSHRFCGSKCRKSAWRAKRPAASRHVTDANPNIVDLHQMIAEQLIAQPYLTGREFRFLRVEMDMTQREVGEYLGVGPQSVAMWEKSPRVLLKADRIIRALFKNLPTRQIASVLDAVKPARFVQHIHNTHQNWLAE